LSHGGWVKDGLSPPFPVSDIDKDETAQIAAGMDPATQSRFLPDMFRADLIAVMRSFHLIQNRVPSIRSPASCPGMFEAFSGKFK
jgi:hypothetical protein